MANVVITGTSRGLGHELVKRFLNDPDSSHKVYGIDVNDCDIKDSRYVHFIGDISDFTSLPTIEDVDILINNAGTQTEGNTAECVRDIRVNLEGTINCVRKYVTPRIKSIVNICSMSAHTGADFPYYVASKGGILSYTKNVAIEVSKYGATCNSISHGGTYTHMNDHIFEGDGLLKACFDETLLKKWVEVEEVAEWVYFVAVKNKSMTGQDIIIDNGECAHFNFIW